MKKWKQKRNVKHRYDVTADMYDARYAEEQEAKYKAALAGLRVTGVVLDVGCGTGLFFNQVAAQADTLVGVDVSLKLLLKAKERAKTFHNVHVIQADADHLPFQSDCFNLVFAFTVLQNMPQPAETLNELKRAAKRNGAIVVSWLKKVFSLDVFEALLQQAGLLMVSLNDAESLKCYVTVTVKNL
jgi:ubiquinone/menaquinone biosynthesis C-methylase UbiE